MINNVTMKAKDAVSAKLAECFVTVGSNRYNCMTMKNFEAKIEKKKTKVPILGKTGSGNKSAGWEGTFSATMGSSNWDISKQADDKKEVSLDEPLNVDWDGNELLLSDILGTEENEVYKDIEEDVERQLVFDAINRLKRREREIMCMRFGLCGEDPLTQKEVAQKLDISQSYISRLEKKIIDKIRKEVLKTK